MKVLFCTNAFEKVNNGPAKFAHLLLEEAGNADFEIRILTEDVIREAASVYKLYLNIPRLFKPFGQFIRMWKYHREAMKIKRDYSFDILVYNNAMIGLLSTMFFKRTVGMINDYSNADHSLISVFKNKAKFNKRVLFYYIECITCHLSKCIIVNSEYLKAQLQQRYHSRLSLFKVLYKGIENKLVTFNRKEVFNRKIKGSVLFVKTDFILGGLLTLVDALKNINKKVILTIIGPSKECHRTLEDLLNESHISFELFDYIKPGDVYKKMQQSEIFCVPSKREAFGVANLEAMAMGCKIVSTDIGGIPEAVGGNRFAWLVRPDDPLALQNAIIEALNASVENDLNGIAEHLNQFSSTRVVTRFKEILEKCF